MICQHITYLDLHLLKVIETQNLGAGVFSGIEALTLPFGQHFREAAIERYAVTWQLESSRRGSVVLPVMSL